MCHRGFSNICISPHNLGAWNSTSLFYVLSTHGSSQKDYGVTVLPACRIVVWVRWSLAAWMTRRSVVWWVREESKRPTSSRSTSSHRRVPARRVVMSSRREGMRWRRVVTVPTRGYTRAFPSRLGTDSDRQLEERLDGKLAE